MKLFLLLTTILAMWGNEPRFPVEQEDVVSTAVDSSGKTFSVWVEKDQVWASESVAIGSWSMPTLLSSPNGKASSPRIEIAPSGEAIAVWVEDNSVKAATRSSFGEWKPSLIAPTSLKDKPKPFDFSLSGHPMLRLKPKLEEGDGGDLFSARKMHGKSSKENQIEALSVNAIDAPTGKNLTGAQIGFAVGQAAPSDGLIVSGVSGFGISAPSVQTQVTISPFSSAQIKGLLITGSFSGVAQAGISSSATYTNNASNFAQSVISSPVFAAAGATTISNASCFYASPFLTGNAGTVSTMSGIYYDGGGPLVGTVTFSYGGFFANPAAGTTKVALYADNAAIGYSGVTPPTNGLIVTGQVGIGSNSVASGTRFLVNLLTGDFNGIQMTGTINSDSLATIQAISQTPILKPTNNNVTVFAVQNSARVDPNANVVPNAYSLNVACIGLDSVGGSITHAYSGFFNAPNMGTIPNTSRTALYTDDITVGYLTTTPPTNGAIISGHVGIGTNSPTVDGYVDVQGSVSDSAAIYGTLLRTNLTETGSGTGTCELFVGGTHTINGSTTNTASWIQVSPTATATTTISNSYGVQIMAGSGSGTVTNAYGLFSTAPGYGTNKTAIYGDNASIGYTGVTPPTNGLLVNGNTGIGTTVPSTTFNVLGASTVEAGSEIGSILLSGTKTGGGSLPRFAIGINYDGTTMNYSWMQSVETGSGVRHLAIQPDAARGVVIGSTVNPLNTLSVGGNLTVGANYVAISAPTNGALFQGQVGIGVIAISAGVTLQVAGTIAPNTNKISDVGMPNLRWGNVYCAALPGPGTSRLAPSRTLCPLCNKIMMRGTGTIHYLGEEADYIPVFCVDCCSQKIEALSHLPKEKLALRRPPPPKWFSWDSVSLLTLAIRELFKLCFPTVIAAKKKIAPFSQTPNMNNS